MDFGAVIFVFFPLLPPKLNECPLKQISAWKTISFLSPGPCFIAENSGLTWRVVMLELCMAEGSTLLKMGQRVSWRRMFGECLHVWRTFLLLDLLFEFECCQQKYG